MYQGRLFAEILMKGWMPEMKTTLVKVQDNMSNLKKIPMYFVLWALSHDGVKVAICDQILA